jgi:hypothetical protein
MSSMDGGLEKPKQIQKNEKVDRREHRPVTDGDIPIALPDLTNLSQVETNPDGTARSVRSMSPEAMMRGDKMPGGLNLVGSSPNDRAARDDSELFAKRILKRPSRQNKASAPRQAQQQSEVLANTPDTTPDNESGNVIYYQMGAAGPEVFENGVTRPAFEDEQTEIAQQHAGGEPSTGMPRYEYGAPPQGAEPVMSRDRSVEKQARNEIEKQLGEEAGRLLGTRRKFWIKDDGRAIIVENGVAVDIAIGGSQKFGKDDNSRLYWHGPESGWLNKEMHDKIEVKLTGQAIPNDEALNDLLHKLEVRNAPNPNIPRIRQTQEYVDENLNRQTPRGDNGDWNDPHLVYGSGERGHMRPSNWDIDPEKYIGVSPKRIPQILANPRDQQFFGEILRAIAPDKGDVLLRYKNGNATADDMDFMTYGAYEYSKWMHEGEKVASEMTAEDVELMGRRNVDMRNLISHSSEGRELEVMKDLVLHTAMRDGERFGELADAFKELRRARDTYRFRHAEERINAQSERLGIKRKDYGVMFNLKNPTQRKRTEARLAAHIHEEAGGFRRAIDWVGDITRTTIPGSSRYKAILETMEASRITPNRRSITSPTSWVQDTIKTRLDDITEYLGATVADPEIRRAVTLEALSNEKRALESTTGPKTYAEVQRKATTEFTQPALQETIRARIASVPNFSERPSDEQDSILSDIRSSEQEKQGKGRGFFAWLASIFFSSEFNKAAGAVMNRPVRA